MKKCCAVCGDTTPENVKLVWYRFEDSKEFNVCLYCAEQKRVNASTVNHFAFVGGERLCGE